LLHFTARSFVSWLPLSPDGPQGRSRRPFSILPS
jgi:hypothetical protein